MLSFMPVSRHRPWFASTPQTGPNQSHLSGTSCSTMFSRPLLWVMPTYASPVLCLPSYISETALACSAVQIHEEHWLSRLRATLDIRPLACLPSIYWSTCHSKTSLVRSCSDRAASSCCPVPNTPPTYLIVLCLDSPADPAWTLCFIRCVSGLPMSHECCPT